MNIDQELRVGVVGLGWAGETHLQGFLSLPNVRVVAVSDTRADHAEAIRAKYDLEAAYTDYNELVARPDLDIVSVATPNYLHMPVSVAALQHGKHVLCEKPLALDSAEGQAMVDAAIAADRVLEVSFNHRKRGDVEVLRQALEDDALGRIYYAKAFWMRRRGIPGMGGWFTTRRLSGGGPLIDLGVHVLDMALYLLGDPEVLSVSAQTYSEIGVQGIGSRGDVFDPSRFDVEDLATAFIRLEGGITLLLEASWASNGENDDDFGVALYGTKGGGKIDVRLYASEDTLSIYHDIGGAPAVSRPKVYRGAGHAAIVQDFVNVIRSGSYADHRGVSALRRTRIIEACYTSAQTGREVILG
ncbi:Gfo/Idh/MocA family oxidoreductase [Geitlerinema splendidum]|jgi:predicted dehydrogenase|nr:Gfo/Idh/MocA family oxidoreductase [Geitlerinema splendidum]